MFGVQIMNVETDPRVAQWLELIEASESTRKTYTNYMKLFCGCVDKTPSELITEAIQETRDGKLLSERNTVIYLTELKKCIKDKAPKTQGVALSTVQSFYKTFDIQLSSVLSKRKKRMPLKENQNFLTYEDVKTLTTNAKNLRIKAIILCMVTSGMAKNEILNLKIEDIEYDNEGIGIIRIRRKKTQTDYTTFISPEAVISLKNYLDERNRDEELKIKGNSDFVFVTYGRGSVKGKNNGGQIAPQTFNNEFQKMGKELGYGTAKGFFVKSRSHSLRKFFSSTLENAGMPKNKIEFMLGHTVNGNDLAYYNTDIGALKEVYKMFLPYLTFEKTIEVRSLNTEDAKRLERFEIENEKLKERLSEMEKQKPMLNEDMIKSMIEARVSEILKNEK